MAALGAQIRAVFRREWRERVTRPGYWAALVLGMVLMVAMVVVPSLIEKGIHPSVTVGSLHVPQALLKAAAPQGVTVVVKPYSTMASALNHVRQQHLTGFFRESSGRLLFYGQVNTQVSGIIANLDHTALIRALPPSVLADVARAQAQSAVKVVPVSAGAALVVRSIAVYALNVVMMILIMTYGVFIGMSVVEEKESRHAEMLMAWTRPQPLLFGKLAGFFALAFLQLSVWAVTGLTALAVKSHQHLTLGLSPSFVVLFLVWAIIGYLEFGTAFATLASRAQRSSELNQAVMPMSVLALLGYFGSVLSLAHPGGTLAAVLHVAAFVPFLAPLVAFSLLQLGGMPTWQVILDVLWQLVFWWGLLNYAARLFHRHLLNYQQTLPQRGIRRRRAEST